MTFNVIENVEDAGFCVVRIVADYASINVKLFELLHKDDDSEEHWIWHPLNLGERSSLASITPT